MKANRFSKVLLLALALSAAAAIVSQAQTVTTIANFPGYAPYSGLVQAPDGTFYGTNPGGEIGDEGSVYNVTASGTLATICNFGFGSCPDGQFPTAPLVLASNGYFYGTTQQGGSALEGNLFKMTTAGAETNLYSFCVTTCDDGAEPEAAIIQAGNGELYGTTGSTVYKVTLNGTLTTIYSFLCSPTCADGVDPGALVQASDGNFYGVTGSGGANNDGTVFRITPSGILTTLHNFNGEDGATPLGSLVQLNGELYGVTYAGGKSGTFCQDGQDLACGTIFKISLGGSFKNLHKFTGTDGGNPCCALTLGTDGNFYGTAQWAGANMSGTLFQITPAGTFTTLYNFCSQEFCLDGVRPTGSLLQAASGTFYGLTGEGGTQGNGVVYSLSMGLGPFVATAPTSGKVASNVIILGYNLTGTTSVTFNGIPASFTVASDTEITTTVPAGATTGKVKVVTPTATLNSNVAFGVVP